MERLSAGIRYLEGLGYRVQPAPNLLKSYGGYLAGTDNERASDVMWAFTEPGIDAVMCVRGGYGAMRLLRLIDLKAIAASRRMLVAFSDGTALQNALFAHTGMVSIAGLLPSVDMAEPLDSKSEELFWHLLTSTTPLDRIAMNKDIVVEQPGTASGRLIGGNLAVFTAMVGSEFIPTTNNAIVLLEDVAEAPYRVDRMLCQLNLAGMLENTAGIVFGLFTGVDERPASVPSRSVEEVVREYASTTSGPVLSGVPHGHAPLRVSMPIGLQCTMSSENGGWLSFNEAAVA